MANIGAIDFLIYRVVWDFVYICMAVAAGDISVNTAVETAFINMIIELLALFVYSAHKTVFMAHETIFLIRRCSS
jgi:hypothetical protein